MKTIPVRGTRCKIVVDNSEYSYLSRFTWRLRTSGGQKNGRPCTDICLNGRVVTLTPARVILGGDMPVYYIDSNPFNCRKENLCAGKKDGLPYHLLRCRICGAVKEREHFYLAPNNNICSKCDNRSRVYRRAHMVFDRKFGGETPEETFSNMVTTLATKYLKEKKK